MNTSNTQLHKLANLYGIKTSYTDVKDRNIFASDEALIAVLASLRSPLAAMKDVPSALREKKQQYWTTLIEPVLVVWDNEYLKFKIRIPVKLFTKTIAAFLTMEDGESKEIIWSECQTLVTAHTRIEGEEYISLNLSLSFKLTTGYHSLKMEFAGSNGEALIISAPRKAYLPSTEQQNIWGIFSPLYALHSKKSWGAGDFSDIEAFMNWISKAGANLMGTLPLLPSFFDDKFGPGPYMPASRLFWNEFYLDIDQIPELERCPEARILMNSKEFQDQISALRSSQVINYQQQLALKRKILENLSTSFFNEKPERFFDFQLFCDSHHSLEDYAAFRASGEKQGLNWNNWRSSRQNGQLESQDFSIENKQYHLYTQWLAQDQIQNISLKAKQDNTLLYLDFPVGVHPYSYDVWRNRNSFTLGVNGGAPPDPVFTNGQNWNFPPLHPENIRKDKYGYVIKCLRHQMRQAGMLRIDHVMSFHRLFWIPEGMDNKEGVYVGYKAEELYAILTLESCRNKTIIVGEDLGMVPSEVRPMMDKHGIFRMFVGQYQLITENRLGDIPSRAVASLNTHDMYPFASFWQETDIQERQKLKLLSSASAKKELENRRETKRALISGLRYLGLNNDVSQDAEETLKSLILLLGSSRVFAVLLNIEDLWLETHPQNIPGTQKSQNWSRKARYSIDQFSKSSKIRDILCKLNNSRKGI
jgi:4-alpha-glucanotransferase